MNTIIQHHNQEAEGLLQHFRKEMSMIRTGQANPSLLDHVMIEAYGTKTPLRELAAITVSDAKTLMIQPWDKNLLKDIERGINDARVGLSPAIQGAALRLSMPSLTEETRRDITKILKQKTEDAKQTLRKIRDHERESILQAEREKKITEDDRYRSQKELDDANHLYQDKIMTIALNKEKEIMTV